MGAEIKVHWNEDGDATVMGRITARNTNRNATGVDGEGYWIDDSDVTSVERNIFDLDGETPDTAVGTGTLTVSTVVVAPTGSDNILWTVDDIGYNFIDDIPAANFPVGNRRYRIEYTFTLSGGAVFHASYEGQAKPIRSS